MIRNAGVFYFSGTGNTEIVAQLIKENFTNKEVNTELFNIEDYMNYDSYICLDKYDIVGIGYPIHAFNAPKLIFDFIKTKIKCNMPKKVFLFYTCAGPLKLNEFSSIRLKRVLLKRNCEVINERVFYISSNLIVKFPDELIKQLFDAAKNRVDYYIDEILSMENKLKSHGLLPTLFAAISSSEGICAWITGKDFYVNKSCTKCKTCIKACPKNNISIKNHKVKFGWSCMACLRCIYTCPVRAINARVFSFAIIKETYNIKKVLNSGKASGNYINKNAKGYYKIYYDYINNHIQY